MGISNGGEYCRGIYGRVEAEKSRASFQELLLKEGSLASIWRYKPTPESSEGAGDATGLFAADVGVLVAGLACD